MWIWWMHILSYNQLKPCIYCHIITSESTLLLGVILVTFVTHKSRTQYTDRFCGWIHEGEAPIHDLKPNVREYWNQIFVWIGCWLMWSGVWHTVGHVKIRRHESQMIWVRCVCLCLFDCVVFNHHMLRIISRDWFCLIFRASEYMMSWCHNLVSTAIKCMWLDSWVLEICIYRYT